MGEVYRARDIRLQRLVAIKTLSPESPRQGLPRGFDREARAVAALSHPNILAIHDVGTHDGIPYLAVEMSISTWASVLLNLARRLPIRGSSAWLNRRPVYTASSDMRKPRCAGAWQRRGAAPGNPMRSREDATRLVD